MRDNITPPGTVVEPPARTAAYEPAATGADAPIPYEKADRTPQALQHLEAMAIDLLSLDPQRLVALLGAIEDKGSVAMFGEVEKVGADFRIFRVVSFDAQTKRFTHASRFDRVLAERVYDQRRDELS
jgi:hypothetical protein